MSKTQTEKATARPWQVLTANDYKSIAVCGPGKFIDAPIIAEIQLDEMAPDYAGSAAAAFNCDDNDEPKANAALIVRAVNEYAALNAVAEAAQLVSDERMFRNDMTSAQFAILAQLRDCLAELNASRKASR